MDKKAGFFSDLKGGKNGSVLCFRATMSTSSGIWLGEHPLEFSFPLLLCQLSVIFLACYLVHLVLGRVGLPKVISHTIAGIILGPSCLSRNHSFQETIFPLRSWVHLELASELAFVLFIFVVGVKTDLAIVRRSGRKSVAVAVVGTLLPFAIVIAAAAAHPGILADPSFGNTVTNVARRWALSSNTVVACLLAEFNLLTTKLGRLAMSASLFADILVVALTALFNSVYYSGSIFVSLATLVSFLVLILMIWGITKALTIWIVRHTPDGATLDDNCFVAVLLLALGSSIGGELLGETLMAGPVFFGLLLPSGPPLGTALVERLMSIGSEVFLPVFFATAGLRTNLFEFGLNNTKWKRTAYLIAFAALGKTIGVIIPCVYTKMSLRDSFILALILNSHGVVEIFSFNNWEDSRQADAEVYSMNMLAVVLIGGSTGALLKFLYGKSPSRLAATKRRNVQNVGMLGELRVLTCVHGEDNVPPLLTLVKTINPSVVSPLCIYLLHLSPLIGQNDATLSPYKKKKKSSQAPFKSLSTGSTSDRIINSFLELQRQHSTTGCLTVIPFIGVSPYATMHDDICSLAQDKMVDLILLPFHRRIDGIPSLISESIKPAVRAVNTNVVLYAPCTVAIVVDRGFNEASKTGIVVLFFIGEGDDREALAVANRMVVENSSVELTVIRFVVGGERGEEGELDDEVVEEFLVGHERNGRVVYREEEVREGAETVEVMREWGEKSGLIVVGRGEGRGTAATSGLEMWSEFPELGVVGDMLASADFGGNASVMVVMRPARDGVGGGGGGGGGGEKYGGGDREICGEGKEMLSLK